MNSSLVNKTIIHWFTGIALVVIAGIFFAAPALAATVLPFDPQDAANADKANYDTSYQSKLELATNEILDLGTNDPLTVTFRIINTVLTLLGFGFLIIIIYAGFLWAWARGNTEEIEKAKNLIRRAIIGFIIILGSLGISMFVFYIYYVSSVLDLDQINTS